MSIGFENFLSGMNATLLWENPNPNVEFAKTTFDFDVNKFDYVLIKVKSMINKEIYSNEIFELNSETPNILWSPYHDTNINLWNGDIRQRILTKNSSGKLTLSEAKLNGTGISNGYAIPVKIYGLKGKVLGVRGG